MRTDPGDDRERRGLPAGVLRLEDRDALEARLRRNAVLHLYALGDLDDFYWPHTAYFGSAEPGSTETVLLYTGANLPVLLAFTADPDRMRLLLTALLPALPSRVYAHMSSGVETVFEERFRLRSHGPHLRMWLRDPSGVAGIADAGIAVMGRTDLPDLVEFYRRAYPGGWFDPMSLDTGHCYAVRENGRIVSAGGVHVVSRRYRVAALGNVATLPDRRGSGLAARVCAHLCRSLLAETDLIGLNVAADNRPAIRLYERLGFASGPEYGEYLLELR